MSHREINKEILAVFLQCCLLLFLFSPKTFAAEVSLRIKPTIINIHPQENGIVEKKITIENTGRETLSLDIFLKPFSAGKNGEISYAPSIKDAATLNFINQNVQVLENDISASSISLAPGQSEQVTLHLNINNVQEISEYTFSALFVSSNRHPDSVTSTSEETTTSQLQLHAGSAVHILITGKKPGMEQPLLLRDFSTNKFFEKGPVPFSVSVKNSSETYKTMYGSILISNLFGQKIGLIRIPNQILLAGSQRNAWSASSGSNEPILWNQSLLVGPYKARLSIVNENGHETTSTIGFFAFPLRTSLITLSILFFTSLVVSKLREKIK